jgi:diguanylate cyclase (GGDEF)-like protein/PAS domain S-box-containing protein
MMLDRNDKPGDEPHGDPEGASRSFAGNPKVLRSLVEYAADAFFVHDYEGHILGANRQACDSLRYSCDELLELRVQDVEVGLSSEEMTRAWGRMVPGHPVTLDGVHRRKDGSTFPVEVRVGLVEVEGRLLMLALARDVTERKEAEDLLQESERRFRQLFEQSVDALFLHDEEGRIVDCNKEACRSLGYARGELLELSIEEVAEDVIPASEREARDDTPWRRALRAEHPGSVSFHVNRHRRKDGTTFPVEVGIGSIEHRGRRLILASCRDITVRKELEEALSHQASHDGLTGLPNRQLFAERLAQALSRSDRRGEKIAVIFVDLDDFKAVNDSLGHRMGDRLLVAAAERLRACTRTEDTVARLGGDEFVVLLEDLSSQEEALQVANRALRAMRRTFVLDGHELSVTCSLGVTLRSSAGQPRDRKRDLVDEADQAMYEAKTAGKNNVRLYRTEEEER